MRRRHNKTHGNSRNEITEANAAERDETEVRTVPVVPLFPCIKQKRA